MPAAKEEQSAGDFWANVLGVIFLVLCIVGFIIQNWVYFIVPFALAIAGIAAYLHFSSNAYHVKTAWQAAKRDYDVLQVRYQTITPCPPDKIRPVVERILSDDDIDTSQPSAQWYVDTVVKLYNADYRGAPFPDFPSLEQTRDSWHLTAILDDARKVIDYVEQEITRFDLTMDLVKSVADAPWSFVSSQPSSGHFAVQMFEAVPNIRDMVTGMSAHFFLSKYCDLEVGEWLRNKYLMNLHEASLRSKTEAEITRTGNVVPGEFEGSAKEVVETYFGGTPFLDLFAPAVPLTLSQQLRYEHGVIVAGTGGGKTQLLEALVIADLDEDDPPGVMVIDSKGEMVERIAHLDLFHPDHGRLRDRLVIIDHSDKPALNLFDIDPEAVEQRFNQIESLMKYFFGSLFDSKTSDQMDTLLIPLLHIVLRKEGATLRTLVELVRNPLAYPKMLDQIPPDSKDFILNHFKDSFYAQTKSALITRLSRLTQDVSLSAMFTSPGNSVDLGRALNEGKIVLVNTDAEGLVDRSPIFGKYFIAQAYNAGLSRGSRQGQKRRPIHVYIDECEPYLDHKLEKMLTTIRSYGVGVMMAFQGEWQMTGYQRVIQGNTSIKILGHLRDEADAKLFASNMRTNVDFLMAQRKDSSEPPQYGNFGCYTTELNRTVSITVPFYQLDQREQMSEKAYRHLRNLNRDQVTRSRDIPPTTTPDIQPVVSIHTTAQAPTSMLAPHYAALEHWTDIEMLATALGAINDFGNVTLGRLSERLDPEQLKTYGIARDQRNDLIHHKVPIPDLPRWIREVHALHAVLARNQTLPPPADDPTAPAPDF